MMILRLFNLRTGELTQVAWSETLTDMVKFLEAEVSLIPYTDGLITKVFKMDSVLEDYAGTDDPRYERMGVLAIDDVGTVEEWVQGTIANFNQTQELLHTVPTTKH